MALIINGLEKKRPLYRTLVRTWDRDLLRWLQLENMVLYHELLFHSSREQFNNIFNCRVVAATNQCSNYMSWFHVCSFYVTQISDFCMLFPCDNKLQLRSTYFSTLRIRLGMLFSPRCYPQLCFENFRTKTPSYLGRKWRYSMIKWTEIFSEYVTILRNWVC